MRVSHYDVIGGFDMKSNSRKYDQILKASIEIISEKGLDKTSISDIVNKTGIAQGTFLFIFPIKKSFSTSYC